MGIKLSWIAVQGESQAALLDRLGFEVVGEISDEANAPYVCAEFAGGWTVVAAWRHGFAIDDVLPLASAHGLAVGGEANETVMFSRAAAFRDGEQLWSVDHDPDKAAIGEGLEVEGDLPPQFAKILADIEAEQAADTDGDVDYEFDAPVKLVQSLCGYEAGQGAGMAWFVLARQPAAPISRSLRVAIAAEIVPLLASLGWERKGGAGLPSDYDVHREHDDQRQKMWFQYKAAPDEYSFTVSFAASALLVENGPWKIYGRVTRGPKRAPIWSRLFGRGKETVAEAAPIDPIDRVIAQAREDILLADAYLKTGATDPRVQDFCRPVKKR